MIFRSKINKPNNKYIQLILYPPSTFTFSQNIFPRPINPPMRRFNEIKLIERRNFNERINSIATNLFAARRRAHEGADYNYLPTPSPTTMKLATISMSRVIGIPTKIPLWDRFIRVHRLTEHPEGSCSSGNWLNSNTPRSRGRL